MRPGLGACSAHNWLGDMPDVFLSYAREDTKFMKRLQEDLGAARLDVWTDENLEPGSQPWQEAIEEAIEQSCCLVVILSPHSKGSPWVRKEITYARTQEVRVFSVLARGNKDNAVQIDLIADQWLDARKDYRGAIQKLIQGILAHCRETPPPPPPPVRRLLPLWVLAVAAVTVIGIGGVTLLASSFPGREVPSVSPSALEDTPPAEVTRDGGSDLETPPPEESPTPSVEPEPRVDAVLSVENAHFVELLHELSTHGSNVYKLAFSHDSASLASGEFDGAFDIWTDPWEGPPVAGHAGGIMIGLAFNSDDTQIVTSNPTGLFTFWSVATGERQIVLTSLADLGFTMIRAEYRPEHGLAVLTSAFSEVWFWDLQTDNQLGSLQIDVSDSQVLSLSGLAISSDGTKIAAVNEDRLGVWAVPSGNRIFEEDLLPTAGDVEFSPDGLFVAYVADDGQIRIIEVDSGAQVAQFDGHTDHVTDLAFSPDGSLLVSSSYDGTIRLWNADNGLELARLDNVGGAGLGRIAVSPDGKLIASGDGVSFELPDSQTPDEYRVRLWGIPPELVSTD